VRFHFTLIFSSILLFAPSFGAAASKDGAADPYQCENSFRRFMPAGDHPALKDSAYGIQWTKLGSVFLTQRDGLPYYSPVWHLGVFSHPYTPIVLLDGGSLQPTAGTLSTFPKGEMLYLIGQSLGPDEVRLKLLSKNKFSIKPNDPKPTDRVSLELVIPKGSGWCNAQKNFESWMRGFGGLVEAERFQQIGDRPPPPGVPPPDSPAGKVKMKKEVVEKEEEPAPVATTPSLEAQKPSQIPPGEKKLLEPTSVENLYPPKETDLRSGMSRKEVDAKLGAPINIIKSGEKSVVYYEDVIVEFVKDRLTDIRISDKPAPSVLKRYH